MNDYEDLHGRRDVCDSYSIGERLSRTSVETSRRAANTLKGARKCARGYFTVMVEIDSAHTLTYDGESWTLTKDTRGEYDYDRDGDGYGVEGVDYVYEDWKIEEPNLELGVTDGGKGEDIVLFHADGWGLDELQKISWRDEVGTCFCCWELIKDIPRRNSRNVPRPVTDAEHARHHNAGTWWRVIGPDRAVIREECDRPGCRCCPDPYKEPVNQWAHLVGKYRRTSGAGWCKVILAPSIPGRGLWSYPWHKVVEVDLEGEYRLRVRIHGTTLDPNRCQDELPSGVADTYRTVRGLLGRHLTTCDEYSRREINQILALL